MREKPSLFRMVEKVVVANGHFVDHASSICGSSTNPITIMMVRNFFSSARLCGLFSHSRTLENRDSSVVSIYCLANRFVWSTTTCSRSSGRSWKNSTGDLSVISCVQPGLPEKDGIVGMTSGPVLPRLLSTAPRPALLSRPRPRPRL